jgi:type I restriction enzyme S subunit
MTRAVRLRHVAEVNPATPEFDHLRDDAPVTFLPLEAIWPRSSLDTSRVRPKGEVASGYTRFRAGDILIPKITPTFQASRTVLAPVLDHGVGAGTTELHVVRPGPRIDPRYLLYTLSSQPFLQEGEASMTGVAGQKRVPDDFVRDLPVLLRPIGEQRAIADYLDAETVRIDALTSRYLELVGRLAEQRGAITLAGVSGGPLAGPSRSSSLTWLTKVPSHWAEVRLTLLAHLGSGHTPSREHPEWWTDCTIPWITTGEVWQIRDDRVEYLIETREMISELGIANSSAELHPAGTVVLSRTASAGFSAIMATDMATSQDYVTWTCGPLLRPRFLLLCLRSMRPDLLGRLAMGSTHQTIYVPDIQSIRIPLPPLEEQDQLVEWTWQRLHRIDAALDAIRRQVELLAERRQALITAAVTDQPNIPRVAA